MKKLLFILAILLLNGTVIAQKKSKKNDSKAPFVWENATVYFIVTDRFFNGDKTNDFQFNRNKPTGKLRGFEGGDLRGIIQKLDEGYFDRLGINALWMTPNVEQIHDGVDEDM